MSRKKQLTLGRHHHEIFTPSTIPSTQDDINQLEERFNRILYNELALENGLCPKRRRIYDDLFNELIRITTVHCGERGLLLERVRNEYQQWMQTYEELYSSSMAYGVRQYLYKMEEKKNLEIAINTLQNDCQQLRDELEQESSRYEQLNGTNEDRDLNLLRTDVQILRSTNQRIRSDLEKTLNQILTSAIFLSEPIESEEKKNT